MLRYQVEWDTVATFDSQGNKPASFVESDASSPLVDAPDTFFNITGLEMGQTIYVRIRAYTTLGYGFASSVVSGTPMQQPDAPYFAELATSSSSDPETVATTLDLSITPPLSNGGDTVTKYVVEWAEAAFVARTHEQQVITYDRSSDVPFRVALGNEWSAEIFPNCTDYDVQLAISNLASVRSVQVSLSLIHI